MKYVLPSPHLTGALRNAFKQIESLAMPEPDPDDYDVGYNTAIERALKEINAVANELHVEREKTETARRNWRLNKMKRAQH